MKPLPKINLLYWALIISANTMGETVGDLISQTLKLGYGGGTLALLVLFFIAVTFSIFFNSQNPIVYWAVITLASTLGTTISDFISRTLAVNYLGVSQQTGYIYATLFLVFALALTFGIGKFYSKTNTTKGGLSKKTEFLYWSAILTSSTLGTAFGDLLAHDTPLGFNGGTLLLFMLLAIVVLLVFISNVSKEILYWLAIIITHPIGATLGDYLSKREGMNLGNIKASLILVVVFIIITGKLTVKNQLENSNNPLF